MSKEMKKHMNKVKYILIFLLILFAPFVSASLGEFTAGECVSIRVPSTYSQVNISTITIGENTTILNDPMVNIVGNIFNYSYCDTLISGEYVYDWYPCPDLECVNSFIINPAGNSLSLGQTILFIFILFVILFFMIFSIYGINKAAKGEWQIFYICVTYILLFCFFYIAWLISKNYLYNVPIFETVFWITWLLLGGMFLPFLIGVSAYILKKQAESLLVDEYQQQGYTKDESLEMAKSRRRK